MNANDVPGEVADRILYTDTNMHWGKIVWRDTGRRQPSTSQGEAWNRSLPHRPQKGQPCQHLDFWISSFQHHETVNMYHWSCPVCGSVSPSTLMQGYPFWWCPLPCLSSVRFSGSRGWDRLQGAKCLLGIKPYKRNGKDPSSEMNATS